MMRRRLALTLVSGLAFIAGGLALAQTGGNVAPGGSVAKPAAPAKPQGEPAKQPEMTVAGNFGQWALVCGKDKDKDGKEALLSRPGAGPTRIQ